MALITCPKEYSSSQWGAVTTVSDVWEGTMAELLAHRDSIMGAYTTTQISPTKGGHGRLVASITNESPGGGSPGPTGDETIEVEWVELRLPVEKNSFFHDLTNETKGVIRKLATAGAKADELSVITDGSDWAIVFALYELIAGGTSDYSTGVPVVRRTTRGAGSLTKGSAWYRETPPATIPGDWEFLKTCDRRTKVGGTVHRIEEWTGSAQWDTDLYPE